MEVHLGNLKEVQNDEFWKRIKSQRNILEKLLKINIMKKRKNDI
jgi:hypothetical protein